MNKMRADNSIIQVKISKLKLTIVKEERDYYHHRLLFKDCFEAMKVNIFATPIFKLLSYLTVRLVYTEGKFL